jgi:ABC-type uncharacterized transport system permease subunit
MFKNLDSKQKAYGTLGLFLILAFVFWQISDQFALWTSTANPWIALIVSIIINPAYAFLIYFLWKEYDFRGLIAGIIISIGVDIISLSHSIVKIGAMPTDPAFFAYADTTFFKIINPYFQGQTATFILYVIIPALLFYLALRIIRRNASFNKIFRESI